MAKSNRFFSFTLFLLATAIVTSALEPELAEETDKAPVAEDVALAPESDIVDLDENDEDEAAIPPEPPSQNLRFLNECVSNMRGEMSEDCVEDVFKSLFQDSRVELVCCEGLMTVGKPCHMGLVKAIFSFPEYKANASLGVPRGEQVWNQCADDYFYNLP